jgi:hypothetical protein
MRSEGPILSFGLPEGRLELCAADLVRWAEHLVWCYRLMGVAPGSTIGVVDFGVSPTAFLGSRLLTPTLEAGVAELLPGRVICLDASRERVALIPSILSQVRFDVLIVREEVAPVLAAYCREAGSSLDDLLVVTAFGAVARDSRAAAPFRNHRRMLMIESDMLLAPQCQRCGRLHLRQSVYERAASGDGVIVRATGKAAPLPHSLALDGRGCPDGSADWLISLPEATSKPWAS